MNHHISTTSDAVVLKEHIYSFIDSKLQFINYQINKQIKSFKVDDSKSVSFQLPENNTYSSRFEDVLERIEVFSKMKSKLLIIRKKLSYHNAQLSFELLTDNKYLKHTEKHLENMLDKFEAA